MVSTSYDDLSFLGGKDGTYWKYLGLSGLEGILGHYAFRSLSKFFYRNNRWLTLMNCKSSLMIF